MKANRDYFSIMLHLLNSGVNKSLYISGGVSRKSLAICSLVGRVKPLLELSEGPDTFLFVGAFCADDAAHAMLHAVDPLAAIFATV